MREYSQADSSHPHPARDRGPRPGARTRVAVVGAGGVPPGAKGAVISIQPQNNVLPLTVRVGPSGGALAEVLRVAPLAHRPVTAVVPLGADGNLNIQTIGSWADMHVTLLGWTG